MRKTALTLATLFALTGAAMAGNDDAVATDTRDKAPIAVDLQQTGSISDTSDEQQKPRLGYEGSPWFITNGF